MTTIAKLLLDYEVEIVEYDGDILWQELDAHEYPEIDPEDYEEWAEGNGFTFDSGVIFKPTTIPIEASDGWREAVQEELQYGNSGAWRWGTLLAIDATDWNCGRPGHLEIEKLP